MKRVLVVEDDSAQRYLIVKLLRRHGYEVGEAATLASAREIKGQYDLVVTDEHLGPGELGHELAADRSPAVVVLSGFGPPPGYAGEWILKPLRFEVLLERLKPYLGEP